MNLALSILCFVLAPADDLILVGQENWERPWMPDLWNPPRHIEIALEKRIDVLILGDGYTATERDAFEKDVRDWYERFLTYTPWYQFRGAFRVRGFWTPSDGRATPARESHYRIPAMTGGVGDVKSAETREAVFAAIERSGANRSKRRGRLTHVVPVMLLRNENGRNPSGITTELSSPDGKTRVSMAFAAYSHHEFGHAYGGLQDEYILEAGSKSDVRPAVSLDFFTLTNLSYTRIRTLVPWAHLMPGSAANPDTSSVIGVFWPGGTSEDGVWHSEARCLMNGAAQNWNLQKSRRGANLRDLDRFCFWCEEIVVARTLHKTGQLTHSEDGEEMWERWSEAVRPHYHKVFDVPARIRARNEENAKSNLSGAKIYERR